MGSALWGIAVVYSTFIALGVLRLAFGAIVWLIGKLPVPERLTVRQALLATIGLPGASFGGPVRTFAAASRSGTAMTSVVASSCYSLRLSAAA